MTKDTLKEAIAQKLRVNCGCTPRQAGDGDMLRACAMVLRDIMAERNITTREDTDARQLRQVHYLSLEFLMGRSLMKNAYNLGLTQPLTQAVEEMGFKAADLFEHEPDAGLGNGGLGRLAACYLDSMTTLNIPATGYSICYELGIFKQKIVEAIRPTMSIPCGFGRPAAPSPWICSCSARASTSRPVRSAPWPTPSARSSIPRTITMRASPCG